MNAPYNDKNSRSYTSLDTLTLDDHADDNTFENEHHIYAARGTSRRFHLQIVAMYIAFLVQALVIVFLLARRRSGSNLHRSELLYTPAQNITSYQVKTFKFGIGDDISPFQMPPSDELDAMWQELYDQTVFKIPKEEAALLPNKTSAIPGDPDGAYIAEFDVFHQLHCLNMIRMALYPQRYPEMALGQSDADEHINHCVDSIRQSLMCAADTSTIVWQWDDSQRNNTFRGDVAHTCRDFDAIRDFAREHVSTVKFVEDVEMRDDIRIPIYREDGSSYFP